MSKQNRALGHDGSSLLQTIDVMRESEWTSIYSRLGNVMFMCMMLMYIYLHECKLDRYIIIYRFAMKLYSLKLLTFAWTFKE